MPAMRRALTFLACAVLMCGVAHAHAAPTLAILVYHQIRDGISGPPDSLEVISLERFERQMRYLKENGYVTLSAREVVNFVERGHAAGDRMVAIHFDDGWKSARLALPVLDRYQLKASFWIIAGKGIGEPHMDWSDIHAIARNPRYDIQSHTMTHPWKDGDTLIDWSNGAVPGKGMADVQWELTESRRALAKQLGRRIDYLAWPRGLYNASLIRAAKSAGYAALFTVDDGVNRFGDSALRLRRTMIHGACGERDFEDILRSGIYRACQPTDAKTARVE